MAEPTNQSTDAVPPPCPTCKALREWLEDERRKQQANYKDAGEAWVTVLASNRAIYRVLAKLYELEARDA